MTAQTSDARTIAIAGAGLIGLACAFELSSRGHDVTLFDPSAPERSTGWAAAGMIAPAYEIMLQPGELDAAFAAFCFESAALWKAFAARIRSATSQPLGHVQEPTVAIARTLEEEERLETLAARLETLGHPARRIPRAALDFDLGLSGNVRSGLRLTDDHQIDNRRVIAALRSHFVGAGRVVPKAVSSRADMEANAGRTFDAVVWARGAAERGVKRQVKGQAIAIAPVPGQPRTVLRFGPRYIVPKADRIIIGATTEQTYDGPGIDPGVADTLLAEAAAIVPALWQGILIEHWAGLRPQADGHRPVIGATAGDEFIATAHYRNGVLLAPATARLIADQVEGLTLAEAYSGFAPRHAPGATA